MHSKYYVHPSNRSDLEQTWNRKGHNSLYERLDNNKALDLCGCYKSVTHEMAFVDGGVLIAQISYGF